jgi:tight adherence protein B
MNSFFWLYGIALFAAVSAGLFVFFFSRLKILSSKLSSRAIPPIKKGRNFNLQFQFLIAGVLGFLAIFFGWFWFSAFLTVGLAWMGFRFFPSFKSKWRLKKRIEKMNDLFPQTLGMAVQALKAGQTIPQVLEYLSKESASPLRDEWKRVCNEIDLGSSAEQALAQMGERYPSFSDFNQFLQSYKISRRTGANLTHLLEVLLEGTESRKRLLRKMDAMTAQARLSGLLMGLLPFLLAFVFFTMDPTILKPLVEQKAGWGILVLSLLMELMGFLWIRQLLRIEV